jgi:hypothetical protein
MGVGGQPQAPAALPPGKTRYPLYRRLGTPQGRSGQVRKISPPPGFDARTVQPVASRYIDCAIPSSNKLLQFRVQTDETITYLHMRHVATIRLFSGTSEHAEFNDVKCQNKRLIYTTLKYIPAQSINIPLFTILTAARFPLLNTGSLIYLAHVVGHFLRATLSQETQLIQNSLHTNSRRSCNDCSCSRLVCRCAVALQSQWQDHCNACVRACVRACAV